MKFLLQTDDVTIVEKRVVRHAAMLTDAQLSFASLNSLQHGHINPDIPVDAVPVGTVEFVSAVMAAREIDQPAHLSYPECLRHFLCRDVWEGEFGDTNGNVFVKPRHEIKSFTGALLSDLDPCQTIATDFPVWFSSPVEFISEWRYYVLCGKVVGAGRYDDGEDNSSEPSISTVLDAAFAMSQSGNGLSGYALDFGVLRDGRTALVEANDGWALGYYKRDTSVALTSHEGGCSAVDYAKLLHARWLQMAFPSRGAT